MLFVFATFFDPLLQQLDLFGCELAMRIGGRHAFIGILGCDAINEFTLIQITRYDGVTAALQFLPRIFFDIQPQFRFARCVIRPVTFVTIVRKNGPNIAIKTDRRRPDGSGNNDENSRRETHF